MSHAVDEPVPVLSIGSVLGGTSPPTRKWGDDIRKLGLRVGTLRAGVESPLNLNVVFQVPGEVAKPDFQGVRTGRYSKADRLLMIQVALPEDVPPDSDAHLVEAAYAAIDEAERWAKQRGIAEDLTPVREILDRL